MNEGGNEEREREEGEEDGIPVRWQRPRLGRYTVFIGGDAGDTPAIRKGEEAARTRSTHFFFNGRMRGGFASFCLAFRLFVSFILSG
jgi:hypothetical protein